ncbi:putative clathrin assembly protein At5g35200 isoform X2 [Prosopis cineraria]|uniref:putative clathrin assembly protein At5g35200 isoform X2 n=1 Tax=Prosopis cineraria TaxID=364024 RepID=UPI002410214C|nr:putative clathrin assembly protein At5g35200 isoform X2 [Prosopis cineraria]
MGFHKGSFRVARGSAYRVLDYAITKATNHRPILPKEKHVRTIFNSLSPSMPRMDVVYCIYSLSSRLRQTRPWTVALKTLIIVHRAMRELDRTVWEEFIRYSREREHMLNLLYYQDNSSSNALDFAAWIRSYAHYLDERLRCYVKLNYDPVMYSSADMKFETQDLLQQLPSMQELQFRLLECKPRGADLYNPLLQYALSIVANESVKLYVAITVRVVNLLDKFFEMNQADATKALEIYKRSANQAESLATFFETCRAMEFGRGQKFISIKKAPASFLATLEDYVKEAPNSLELDQQLITKEQGVTPEGDLPSDQSQQENSDPSQVKHEAVAAPPVADLLGLDDLLTGASEFENNSYALAIVPAENSSKAESGENGASQDTAGWELALFSDDNAVSESESTSGEGINKPEGEVMIGTQEKGGNQKDPFGGSEDFEFSVPEGHGALYAYPPAPFFPYPPPASNMPTQQDMSYNQLLMQQFQQQPIVMTQKSNNPFE